MSARILVCTSAIWTAGGDVLNVGDEAISEAVELGARARLGDVEVVRTLNRGGSPAALPPRRVDVHPFGGLARAVRQSDLVVFGGGTLLQDDRGLLRFGAALAATCRALRTPFAVLSVGAEGLEPLRARPFASVTCRLAGELSVRDAVAVDHVRKTLGRRPALGADPLFLSAVRARLPASTITPSGHGPGQAAVTPDGRAVASGSAPVATSADGRPAPASVAPVPVLAVNLRRDASSALLDAVAAEARTRIDAGWRVRLVAMDRRPDEDGQALEALARRIDRPDAIDVVPASASWRDVLTAIAGADLCVGMRLHFAIFAAVARRPLVILTSHPKTGAFADDCGVGQVEAVNATGLSHALRAAHRPDDARLDRLTARADAALEATLAPVVA